MNLSPSGVLARKFPMLARDRRKRGEREILGQGGVLGELTRRLVERALQEELSEHLGYPAGQAPPGGAGNSRNGGTPKTLLTDSGAVPIDTPRDRKSRFEPQLVKKGQRRLAGLDEKISRCTRAG